MNMFWTQQLDDLITFDLKILENIFDFLVKI